MKKLLAWMLVLTMVFAFTAVAFADGEVMSYADYAAAELDSPVVVETFVQAHQSWWDGKVTVYAQDEDGAVFIYNMACSEEDAEKLVPGAKIKVTGFKSEWAGEVEIVDATFEFVDGEPFVAEAEDVTALLGTDELAEKQNKLVAFKGMTVEAYDESGAAFAYKNDVDKTDDLYFKVSKDGNVYDFCVEFYLCGKDTDVYKAVEALEIGQVIDLEGFLYWYEGANPHITSVKPHEETAVFVTEAYLPAEPEFDPNPDYDMYTVVEYTIEAIQADLVCTVSAKADFSEFYQECNFYGDDQMTVTTWDGTNYETIEDKTGFMKGDIPAILDKALEQNLWVPIG